MPDETGIACFTVTGGAGRELGRGGGGAGARPPPPRPVAPHARSSRSRSPIERGERGGDLRDPGWEGPARPPAPAPLAMAGQLHGECMPGVGVAAGEAEGRVRGGSPAGRRPGWPARARSPFSLLARARPSPTPPHTPGPPGRHHQDVSLSRSTHLDSGFFGRATGAVPKKGGEGRECAQASLNKSVREARRSAFFVSARLGGHHPRPLLSLLSPLSLGLIPAAVRTAVLLLLLSPPHSFCLLRTY